RLGLAEAHLALVRLARVVAVVVLGAHLAAVDLGDRAVLVAEEDVVAHAVGADRAAAEAVAPARDLAVVEALLRLHVGAIVVVRVVRAAVAAGAERVALEVPLAVAVAAAGVAVQEAVLLARVHVVAGQPGGEGVLAVVARRDALRIGLVDLAVAVVVHAVAAGVDLALALQRHALAGGAAGRGARGL